MPNHNDRQNGARRYFLGAITIPERNSGLSTLHKWDSRLSVGTDGMRGDDKRVMNSLDAHSGNFQIGNLAPNFTKVLDREVSMELISAAGLPRTLQLEV